MPKFKSYLIGFLFSLLLTWLMFWPVYLHTQSGHLSFTHESLMIYLVILAVCQLLAQLYFFLHLGEKGPDRGANLTVMLSTLGIIVILVAGSLWIMRHLNYNMSPSQMNQYLMHEENLVK